MDNRDPSLIETVAQSVDPQPPQSPAPSSRLASSRIDSTSVADEGRFPAGTLLAGRYRILGLLGRGGMGEVYRATDLMLGQSVALKFLPHETARDHRILERFHGEVRIARQVSHPNVCRVYDIGQMESMPFISMEYVDGEDLSSLLTRIGRLPNDKALDTARRLCAGLAAAHDRGVIHRDLKPQNIMINKRGEVVIMDFGLAAVADQLTGPEARNGTPAYMSPEQLKGAEVTYRSDIYALGLVLYELFTGKRPFEARNVQHLIDLQEHAHFTSMTSLAGDIDPGVEKVIRRCLDADPAKRPQNALAVSAALPGGDALAAALAAGEMPSPEMVAAAGKVEGLPKKYSIPLLAVTLACLFGSIPLQTQMQMLLHAPMDIPPDALQHKAREIAASFGYPARPADSVLWLDKRSEVARHLKELPEPRDWDAWFAAESPFYAIVRESPEPMRAKPQGEITEDNPPPIRSGMIQINIDGNGRLSRFEAVPIFNSGVEPVDAEAVFDAAGLDFAKFIETKPEYNPRHASDRIAAWIAPHTVLPDTKVNVEIAWLKGRVTLARVALQFPDKQKAAAPGRAKDWLDRSLRYFQVASIGMGVFFAILLARRNWTKGRGDRKGALRLALVSITLSCVAWMGTVHLTGPESLRDILLDTIGDWMLGGFLFWLLYLALEPAVRSRWPHSLVSWNRLLASKWSDAQVGSHVLIGAAIGIILWTAISLIDYFASHDFTLGLNLAMLGTRQAIGALAQQIQNALMIGLIGFFAIFGMRSLLRKDLWAALGTAVIFTLTRPDILNSPNLALTLVMWVALYGALIFTLLRFGLVAIIAAVMFINLHAGILISAERSGWARPFGVATLVLLAGIAIVAFWRSLGDQELIGHED